MLHFLPGPLRGSLSAVLIAVNTLFWVIPLLVAHLLKVALPLAGWRTFWSKVQDGVGTLWIGGNNLNLALFNPVRWDVEIPKDLRTDTWYLVVANHQTWVDILVLQRVFNGRIPFLKFFLKKELIYVPVIGIAWWALDYPFLGRTGSASKDRDTAFKACEKFKGAPVSVMNFLEGTRLTPEKHEAQSSPYHYLLKPKVGGVTFVLTAMQEQLTAVLDVTIAYPDGAPTFWGFLKGEVPEIGVRARQIPIQGALAGDFGGDRAARKALARRIEEIWEEKDGVMDNLMA
jgi:1-acyl-sn-glycerol-3-phosphate acyltransferase